MPPKALRAVTKRAAASLPGNLLFHHLAEAARSAAPDCVQLAEVLGRAALQVAEGSHAAVAKRDALQFCAGCGVPINGHTLSSVKMVPLSARTRRRAAAAAATAGLQAGRAGTLPSTPQNMVTVIKTCKVCGNANMQPFASVAAAEQLVQELQAAITEHEQTCTTQAAYTVNLSQPQQIPAQAAQQATAQSVQGTHTTHEAQIVQTVPTQHRVLQVLVTSCATAAAAAAPASGSQLLADSLMPVEPAGTAVGSASITACPAITCAVQASQALTTPQAAVGTEQYRSESMAVVVSAEEPAGAHQPCIEREGGPDVQVAQSARRPEQQQEQQQSEVQQQAIEQVRLERLQQSQSQEVQQQEQQQRPEAEQQPAESVHSQALTQLEHQHQQSEQPEQQMEAKQQRLEQHESGLLLQGVQHLHLEHQEQQHSLQGQLRPTQPLLPVERCMVNLNTPQEVPHQPHQQGSMQEESRSGHQDQDIAHQFLQRQGLQSAAAPAGSVVPCREAACKRKADQLGGVADISAEMPAVPQQHTGGSDVAVRPAPQTLSTAVQAEADSEAVLIQKEQQQGRKRMRRQQQQQQQGAMTQQQGPEVIQYVTSHSRAAEHDDGVCVGDSTRLPNEGPKQDAGVGGEQHVKHGDKQEVLSREWEVVSVGDLYAVGMLDLRPGVRPGGFAYAHHPWWIKKRLRAMAVLRR